MFYSEIGYFVNSIRPDVDTFRESIKAMNEICEGKQNEEIYMYCTGMEFNILKKEFTFFYLFE